MWRLTLFALLLVGCSQAAERSVRSERRAANIAAVRAEIGKTPPTRRYRYDSGEMLVWDVPFDDGTGILEANRCILWRDAEFKTSSLSCVSQLDYPEVPDGQ
jgi:hypothetical protein